MDIKKTIRKNCIDIWHSEIEKTALKWEQDLDNLKSLAPDFKAGISMEWEAINNGKKLIEKLKKTAEYMRKFGSLINNKGTHITKRLKSLKLEEQKHEQR